MREAETATRGGTICPPSTRKRTGRRIGTSSPPPPGRDSGAVGSVSVAEGVLADAVGGVGARFDYVSSSPPQPSATAYETRRIAPARLNRPSAWADDSVRAVMGPGIVHYDRVRHRLWILGQRCHHGATGALVTSLGLSRRSVLLAAAGSALMAHDWGDRSLWFLRGAQEQP